MSGELSRQVFAGTFKIDLVVETDDEVLVNFIEETVVTVPRMREAGQDYAGNNGPVRLIVWSGASVIINIPQSCQHAGTTSSHHMDISPWTLPGSSRHKLYKWHLIKILADLSVKCQAMSKRFNPLDNSGRCRMHRDAGRRCSAAKCMNWWLEPTLNTELAGYWLPQYVLLSRWHW